jgi:hypothetical protein
MIYFFFRLALQIGANADLACVCVVAVGLNFLTTRKRPIWHVYQVLLCGFMALQVYGPEQAGWGTIGPALQGAAAAISGSLPLDTIKPSFEALAHAVLGGGGITNTTASGSSFLSAGVFSSGAGRVVDEFRSAL